MLQVDARSNYNKKFSYLHYLHVFHINSTTQLVRKINYASFMKVIKNFKLYLERKDVTIDVVGTGGAPSLANIFENFRKNAISP